MNVPAGWCIVLRDERGSGRGVFDTTEELEAALRAHRLEGEGGVKEREAATSGEDTMVGPKCPSCGEYDEDLAFAIKLFGHTQRPSASALQRHLRIGYMRAARVLNIMEERGLVGPPRGMEGRECYIKVDAPATGKGG